MKRYAAAEPMDDTSGPLIISLKFDATESAVRDALSANEKSLIDAMGTADTWRATQIVLAEVLNNVVEHAYINRPLGDITVEIRCGPGNPKVEIRDQGGPMPNGSLPGEAMPEFDPDVLCQWPEGGFGWAIIHQLTAGLTYERIGEDNVLRFEIPTAAPDRP